MKTSEAKKKVCPFIQHSAICGVNIELKTEQLNDKYNAVNILCSTSDCMAWVYTKTKSDEKSEQYVKDIGHGEKRMANRKATLEEKDKEGYCQRLKT